MIAAFTSLNHYVTVINHFYSRNKALNDNKAVFLERYPTRKTEFSS
jgi:hypothetical protein